MQDAILNVGQRVILKMNEIHMITEFGRLTYPSRILAYNKIYKTYLLICPRGDLFDFDYYNNANDFRHVVFCKNVEDYIVKNEVSDYNSMHLTPNHCKVYWGTRSVIKEIFL